MRRDAAVSPAGRWTYDCNSSGVTMNEGGPSLDLV